MRGTNEDELCDFVALTENKVSHDGSYQSYSNYSGQTGIGKQFRSWPDCSMNSIFSKLFAILSQQNEKIDDPF